MRVHYPVAHLTLLSMKCFEKAIKQPFCAVPDCLSCLCPKLQEANCTFNQSPCFSVPIFSFICSDGPHFSQ